MSLCAMAAQCKLKIIYFSADGAACELSAQRLNDDVHSELEPLTYSYPQYGIFLSVPVFKDTGPLISITDPPHAQKTCRNQPQYGTHASSLGCGYLVNRSLVDLQHLGDHKAGLLSRDVDNVDKQDDGAARRLFHVKALKAMTEGEGDSIQIIDHFRGLFVYLFIFGTLEDTY